MSKEERESAEKPLPDRTVTLGANVDPAATMPASGPATSSGEDADGSSPAPECIGNYHIERELGRGGMGVVYLAEDPRLRRSIALKVLPGSIAEDSEALARFEREARLLAALNHPNIATIYSLEDDEGLHFFTMELIPGATLDSQLSGGPLPVDDTLSFCRQVARALQAAHDRGVIHRDLKPANIMVSPERQVKILDFGIATAIGGHARTRIGEEPTANEITGTPGYMSPEQLRGETVDQRTDIWAFGCLLYECLTGRKAFAGKTIHESFANTLHGQLDLDALPTETPGRLQEILGQCLARELDARLSQIADARRALEECIARRAFAAHRTEEREQTTIPHNLPRQLTRFVGRERHLAAAGELLRESPLLTLTGTGGSGKTRLSLELARAALNEFPDGIWLAELAPLSDPALVPRTIATTLGLEEQPTRSLIDTINDHLSDRRVLLVLDNCEHLLGACAEIAGQLLRSCPHVRVLATSREGLGIAGERIYQVPSLALPSNAGQLSLTELSAVESIALFVDRAQAAKAGFELTDENRGTVIDICRRLDGIPLALELAAARVRVLPVGEISKRLANRFRFLTGGSKTALPRQQTLRATIDWSYNQLDEPERSLLRRLSVFVGGWNLESAEKVCSGDGIEDWEVLDLLTHLVDKSLVEIGEQAGSSPGVPRYRLLETIRQYAVERLLELSEAATARRRHRDHFLELTLEAHPHLKGPEQASWFQTLDNEHDNLRAALNACLDDENDGGAEFGLKMVATLGRFWLVRGHWSDGRSLIRELLAHPSGDEPTEERAQALGWAGALAGGQGDYEEARRLAEESLAIEKSIGDQRGIAHCLNVVGVAAKNVGDLAAARSHLQESVSICRKLEDDAGLAAALNNLGLVACMELDYEAAQQLYDESLQILRSRDDPQGIAVLLSSSAGIAFQRGDLARARALYDEALAISRRIGNRRTERNVLTNLGMIAMRSGEHERARELLEGSLAIRKELGDKRGMGIALGYLAELAALAKDAVAQSTFTGEFRDVLRELGDEELSSNAIETLGVAALAGGTTRRGVRLLAAADRLRESEPPEPDSTQSSTIEPWLERARRELGPADFQAAWDEGRNLSAREASEEALAADDDPSP